MNNVFTEMNLNLVVQKAEQIAKFYDELGDMPNDHKQVLVVMEFYPDMLELL